MYINECVRELTAKHEMKPSCLFNRAYACVWGGLGRMQCQIAKYRDWGNMNGPIEGVRENVRTSGKEADEKKEKKRARYANTNNIIKQSRFFFVERLGSISYEKPTGPDPLPSFIYQLQNMNRCAT